MEFFFVVKATQKSGKQDAVIWFTAKTEARASLQLDVELEDAGIETGRGKDYTKPVRTDLPVCNDLPEENTVDLTWCERYALQDDGRTWLPKAADAPASTTPTTAVEDENALEIVSVENRNPAVRFAIHLTSDKYQTHVTKKQHMVASEMSLDEGNTYLTNLLLAKGEAPEVAELSLNAEWKLIQAIKEVFSQDEIHAPATLAAFMSLWVNTDPSDRNQLVEDQKVAAVPQDTALLVGSADNDLTMTLLGEVDGASKLEYADDTTVQFNLATMPFRIQLLAQFCADERHVYHISIPHRKELSALELDMDNSYVQSLLLAVENSPEVKKYDMPTLWKLTNAVKKVFPQGKRHELNFFIQFINAWLKTEYIDRGILAREWAAGNRINEVQRTDSGTNADGGFVTDRGEGARHTLDTLDLEIACAMQPMDFNHREIPGSIHRRAKEIVSQKEEPWKSWSAILRNQPGVLAVNRAAIFNLVRTAPENIHLTPVAHLEFVNQTMTAEFNAAVELMTLPAPDAQPEIPREEVGKQLAAGRGEFVEGISDSTDPKWVHEDLTQTKQPEITKVADGMFSIEGLMASSNLYGDSNEATSNVQMEETKRTEIENSPAVSADESVVEDDSQAVAVAPEDILAAAAPSLANQEQADVNQKADSVSQNSDFVNQNAPELAQNEPEVHQDEPAPVYPAYFEPGRYEGLPNEVYHAANGISSTQVKDARVSLMYFEARHVTKTITKERSPVLDMGNLVHALALQPEQLDAEFSVEPVIPEGAFTTAATLRAFIDEHNASLPALLSADDIKVLLEEYNATLPPQVPLGANLEETAQNYMALPADFQRIDADQKQTATAMKACIKEYNATLPTPVKTSGSRDALLEQLAIINPGIVAQEAQKPAPLKVSGTKADMIQAVKAVKPDAVFADELLDAWRDNPEGKVLVTRQQLSTALNIQKALLVHPTAGMLLTHPSRAVEVSYFGFDEATGLEVRVRPDLEIDLDGVRIGADLKTISMWNVKQESLRAKLHREIIERDYHLSAAMYCETAALDQFFWIFVNKDENYHWIAIIEASAELLELGMLEYRKAMRAIATGFDTGEWPAPITTDYTDELNDFDLRRLEVLRTQA